MNECGVLNTTHDILYNRGRHISINFGYGFRLVKTPGGCLAFGPCAVTFFLEISEAAKQNATTAVFDVRQMNRSDLGVFEGGVETDISLQTSW